MTGRKRQHPGRPAGALRFPRCARLHGARLALASLALLLAAEASAQLPPISADPGALQQRRIEEQRRRLQEEELRREPVDDPVDTDAYAPSGTPVIEEGVFFAVREIEFSPSEILTAGELEALAAPYRGPVVSIHDVQKLVAQVNALYRKKGVVTAQAILPPQDLSDGIVRIRLIEGRIGKILVRDNASTDADYVVARVRQQPGDLVDLASLERDLQRFNRTNDAQARAELRPGAEVGQTDVGIILVEPPRHELTLFADNSGSEPTGEIRLGLSYRNRSLFGRRDDLGISAVRAKGQESYSLGYGTPINTLGTHMRVAYYDDRTEVVEGPFADFNINGEATAVIGTLRHPLVLGGGYQIDALVGAKRRESSNRFDTVPFQDSEIRDASLGIEAQRADAAGYWLASATASKGRSELFTGDTDRFGIWRGIVRRSQNLAEGYALIGTVNWQYSSDDQLPASEQFLLGGEYSVRGYSTGVASGDRGYTVNLELHHPVSRWGGEDGTRATGFFFLDYGHVRTSLPAGDPAANETLVGAGWGVNVAFPAGVALRASYASAQRHRPEEEHNYRVLFQLFWTLSANRLAMRPAAAQDARPAAEAEAWMRRGARDGAAQRLRRMMTGAT